MFFPIRCWARWGHVNSFVGVSFTGVSSYNSEEPTCLISQVTTCWCVLLHDDGVARRFFSQQLISVPANGGCGGPNGSEGLTVSQECERVTRWEKNTGREGTQARERFLQLTLFLWPANHSKQTNKAHKLFLGYPLKLQTLEAAL